MGILMEDQRRKVLVGIGFDKESKELLGWALVKVAEPRDHVVALHVCRSSEDASKEKLLLDDYLEIFKCLCDIKQLKLTGQILTGKSIRKSLVKEAKDCSAVAVIVGITKLSSIGAWTSTAKYCAKHLPSTTEILTIHNGKVVFKRSSTDHQSGHKGDPKPSYHKLEKPSKDQSEFGDSEVSETDSRSPKMITATYSTGELLENKCGFVESRNEAPLRPGWPLLRRASLPTQKALDSRKMSVVQWVLSLPDRSPPESPQSSDTCSSKSDSPLGRRDSSSDNVYSRQSSQSVWSEVLEEPALSFESSMLDFTWFSYGVLRHATSQFSSEKLIGKGGYSRVYKGEFRDGKQVAVKVLKSSKQAWKDFSLEVNVMSSLRHRNITPLLGVCVDISELICVYEFMSKGSLEENLHGETKEECGLPWEARFRVAVGIAEALNYLHNSSKPVIHRDVKSSNILLSEDFEPQLSDFGLATWGPSSLSCSETFTDVVGTFGYLAPEYVMYGKVTDKLDVYSFGVVLLELVSGRKPIDSCKAQESLVMWAKPLLESGKLKGLVDPMLGESFDESQMQRVVLAATLCLTRAARLRPNMGQILRLLKGEEIGEIKTLAKADVCDQEKKEENLDDANNDEDEVYGHNLDKKKSHLSLALLDVEDDFTSCSSVEPSNSPCLEDYLKGRCSRSSSFEN